MRIVIAALAALAAMAAPASGEVASANAQGFIIEAEADVTASPERAWENLTHIQRWWNESHTYSGDANRLRLEARAGGCWCERWSGGSVEHGRVVLAMEREGVRTLRIHGGFGPLQALGASGVLTFTLNPQANGAKISMTYRVSGEPGAGLETMAPLVDGVMMEQFNRLIRLNTTGSPD